MIIEYCYIYIRRAREKINQNPSNNSLKYDCMIYQNNLSVKFAETLNDYLNSVLSCLKTKNNLTKQIN